MAQYRVDWLEKNKDGTNEVHQATTISANSMAEAKAKIRNQVFRHNGRISSISAYRVSK